MRYATKVHEPLTGNSGQAMVEFALVLPFLALLTFGTLEVALYLQQQSAINGAAFIAARSAAVLGNDKGATDKALKSYTEATGMPWLQAAKIADDSNKGQARYSLVAGSDRLTGLISGLTGGKVTGFDTLSSEAVLPMEYDARGYYGQSQTVTYKAKTISLIEYPSHEKLPIFSPERSFKNIQNAVKNVNDVLKKISELTPSPKPSAKPKPTPSGAPKPKPTPNVGVTPTPATPKPIPSPPSMSLLNGLDGAKEPFLTRKPVEKNPRRRDDKDDGGQIFSQDYVAPTYEEDETLKDRIKFKMKNIATELKTYEGIVSGDKQTAGQASLEEVCRKVGIYITPYKVNPAIKPLLTPLTTWTDRLWKEADKEYKRHRDDEKKLFAK
jgi:TadE-like protein